MAAYIWKVNMEQLALETKIMRCEGTEYYVEYFPTNPGVEGIARHCVTFTLGVGETIAEKVAAYAPLARDGVLKALNEQWPGGYV